MAYDGLQSEPAVNILKGVKLVTAPLGSMEVPQALEEPGPLPDNWAGFEAVWREIN